jgi:hypothetical protein
MLGEGRMKSLVLASLSALKYFGNYSLASSTHHLRRDLDPSKLVRRVRETESLSLMSRFYRVPFLG